MNLSESRAFGFTSSSHLWWWIYNSGGLEKCGGEEWWWWSVAWGVGGVGGGEDVKAADLTRRQLSGSRVKLLLIVGMLAMRRKWALREVEVTSLDGTFTSFFLSFFLSHTLCCCACWMCMEGWMKASKKAISYSNMYHSCISLSHSFILIHSLFICVVCMLWVC